MNVSPRLISAVAGLWLFAIPGAPLAPARFVQEEVAVKPPRPVETVIHDIRRLGSRAPKGLFDEVVRHGSPEAFEALCEAYEEMKLARVRRLMFDSLLGFQGDEKLTEEITEWLGQECFSDDVATGRFAASALGQFGFLGADAAERVVKGDVPGFVASAALRCIVERASQNRKQGDLRLLVSHFRAGTTCTDAEMVGALSQFSDSKGIARLGKALEERQVSQATKICVMKALGKIGSPRSLGVLHGIVAEPKSAGLLIAIETLRGTKYRKHNRDLEGLFDHANREIAAAAWVGRACLTKNGQPWIKELQKLMSSEDSAQRTVAVLGTAGLMGSGRFPKADKKSVALFRKAVVDEDAAVRAAFVTAALEMRREDLTVILFDAVEVEDPEEREANNRALQLLTGADLGNSSSRWNLWWKKEGSKAPMPSFEAAEVAYKERGRRKNQAARTSFYGLHIAGDNVYFVLDASGSMGAKNYFEETRLEIAKQQAIGALTRMKEGTKFNIIFFGTRMTRFSDELTVLSRETLEKATEYINGQGFLGGTAIYEAIQAAFDDPAMENIYVLSDGAPSGGAISDTEEILSEVAGWNGDRGATLNCIAVGFRSVFLEDLAAANGGQFREAE